METKALLRMGFEPTEESEKTLVTRIQQVLINFKNNIQRGSQIEKCLLFQRTIERINFKKNSLEVVVLLEDRKNGELTQGLANRLGRSARGAREGAVNPDAHACRPTFESKTGGEAGIRTLGTFRFTRFPGVPFQPLTHLSLKSLQGGNFFPSYGKNITVISLF